MKNKIVAMLMVVGLLVSGCGYINPFQKDAATQNLETFQANVAKFKAAMNPVLVKLIPMARSVLDYAQSDYPFFAMVVEGGASIAGLKVKMPPAEAVMPYVVAADAALAVAGPLVNGQAVDVAIAQTAMLAAADLPVIKARILTDPDTAAAYELWQLQQLKVAPANPTSAQTSPAS
jgi:hypothetical protein